MLQRARSHFPRDLRHCSGARAAQRSAPLDWLCALATLRDIASWTWVLTPSSPVLLYPISLHDTTITWGSACLRECNGMRCVVCKLFHTISRPTQMWKKMLMRLLFLLCFYAFKRFHFFEVFYYTKLIKNIPETRNHFNFWVISYIILLACYDYFLHVL